MVSKMSRRLPVLLLTAVLVLPGGANAAGLADCAAVEKAVERLGCFDKLARAAAGARNDPGVWTLDATPSRLNPDLTDLVLWTGALNPVPGPGGGPVHPVLLLRCRQGEMAVVFDFGNFVGGGAVRIEYRIGGGAVLAGDVTVAPDHRRFGVWEGDRAIGFIRALYGQPQLRLRVAPAAGDPLIAAFDLAGLEEAIVPLKDSCGWE
jgi:type VI secretion system protein VasI